MVEGFGPDARKDAMDVSSKILSKPLGDNSADAKIILAANDKIIRIGAKVKPESLDNRRGSLTEDNLAEMLASDIVDAEPAELGDQSNAKPLPLADIAHSSGIQADEFDSDSQANRPRSLDGSGVSRIADSEKPAAAGRNAQTGMQAITSIQIRQTSFDNAAAVVGKPASLYASWDSKELMKELSGENGFDATDIAAELQHRGFTNAQIQVAKRFFDPDPSARKRLVNELPNYRGIDITPWLMELSRDSDAEVRLAAIAFLATSSDPSVLTEIGQIAARDADFRIRGIADRIEKQRTEKR
jgi:hypothetical protein